MRHLVPIVLLGFLACAKPTTTPTPSASATYSFHAVGRSTSGAVIEDLIGEARVYDNEIRIVVNRGIADLRATPTRRPVGLSAGLGYRHPDGSWDFRKQSPVIPVGALALRGDTLLTPVEFRLTGTRGLDLAGHWIVIQQHRYILVQQDGQWHETTRPINSEPDVFIAGRR